MTDMENDVLEYALTLPFAYVDYPFRDNTVVVRHRENKKIFVFVLQRKGQVWVNLKCEPAKAAEWRETYASVIQGYHMNDKARWNTVILDGSVPFGVMEEMIDDSYECIKPKRKLKPENLPVDDF